MKRGKRIYIKEVMSLTMLFLLFVILFLSRENLRRKVEVTVIKVGISVHDYDQEYVQSIVKELETIFISHEERNGVRVNYDISYANQNQAFQNNDVARYISLGYDMLCVNIVDRTSASSIIDMASETSVPVIFFNREPVEDDIYREDNIYYVGTDAKETAYMQSNIIIDAYKYNKKQLDYNQNDTVEYVMLEGEIGHQDALIRSEFTIHTLKERNIKVNQLATGVANWSRVEAYILMKEWLTQYGDQIELVISNNDEMALGALDALKELDYTTTKIVGIDGDKKALEELIHEQFLGTVDCQAIEQAKTIAQLIYSLGIQQSTDSKLQEERYYRIPSKIIVNHRDSRENN